MVQYNQYMLQFERPVCYYTHVECAASEKEGGKAIEKENAESPKALYSI